MGANTATIATTMVITAAIGGGPVTGAITTRRAVGRKATAIGIGILAAVHIKHTILMYIKYVVGK